ncbi:response regulator transcription factor [Planctomicrobium piriforme]|uniref:Response regulator receiver domain-containing protein n=1 Tax=Planctomicrobium piriforme TaxID=1576369 RepID=A0A1I3C5C4_9PLAN|nr:response regulator [Planctomicrobium piriforme]SFH69734.1 Response regulator receiver domain-containing protein [Planctomicrobium piriforme]
MAGSKIVLIEDDREIQTTLRAVLESAGYRVFSASNGAEGQKLIQAESPDLVITDMMMPRMGGFPVLEYLKTLDSAPPVIMITANEGGRHKAYAEMLGAVDYLRKPFAMDVLLDTVRRSIEASETEEAGDDAGPLRRRVPRKKKD